MRGGVRGNWGGGFRGGGLARGISLFVDGGQTDIEGKGGRQWHRWPGGRVEGGGGGEHGQAERGWEEGGCQT